VAAAELLEQQSKHVDAEAHLNRAKLLRRLVRILTDEFTWEWEFGTPTPQTIQRLGDVLIELGELREATICFESLLNETDYRAAALESLDRIRHSARPADQLLSISAKLQKVRVDIPATP